MEHNQKQLRSIWGRWWEPIRKWFYPAWLGYETSIRFYDYSQAVHSHFIKQQDYIASYIGDTTAQVLAIFSSIATFVICSVFLTIPACFTLYRFFKTDNLTGSAFEKKIKTFF